MKTGRIALVVLLFSVVAALCFIRAASLAGRDSFGFRPVDRPTPASLGITSSNVSDATEMQRLFQRRLLIPVEGVDRNRLRDNFEEGRAGTHRHDALDIMAPRGTPVLAADGGRIAKLMHNGAGGNTIYELDRDGHYAYYYAHLDRYAQGLHVGTRVKQGDVIGYVGTTGNATPDAPHLHFTILKLGGGGRLWSGEALNPYPFLVASKP